MIKRNNRLGWFITSLVAFACSEPIATPIATITDGNVPLDDPASCESPITEVDGRIGVATPLSGACSSDPDGRVLTYRWSLADAPAGSESVIQDPSVPGPTFVPDVAGNYKLRLVVSNGVVTSKPAEVEISVNTCGVRAPEVTADASTTSPAIGQTVQLDVSATDEDTQADCAAHDAEFRYEWSFAELPSGSEARLNDSGVRNPSFTPDMAGQYVLHVVSTDPTGKVSDSASVTIEAGACGGNAPVVASIDAAPSDTPATGQAVQLAANVTDADTEDPCRTHAAVFGYDWQFEVMPPGSNAVLNDPHASAPSFIPDVPGDYVLRVTTTDPTGLTATETVTITAGSCGSNAPVVASIDAAPSATPATGQAVQLAANVTDADSEDSCHTHAPVFGYDWQFEVMPAGSNAVLNDPHAGAPSFIPDVPGDYVLRVTTTDPTGLTATEIVTITAGSCGSNAPVVASIDAAPSDAPATGQPVQLAANVTDADTEDSCQAHAPVFVYDWQFEVMPAGSNAVLNDPHASAPSFTPDIPGEYILRVVTTDPTGRSATELANVTASTCGSNAPEVSGIDASPSAAPATGQPVRLIANVTDSDNDVACQAHAPVFTYDWQFEDMPNGSMVSLNDQHASAPSFTPDVPGAYVLRVTTTDPTGRSATELVTINASSCGTNEPTATASAVPNSVNVGAGVQLQGTGADADNAIGCGLDQTLTYDWQLVQLPAGSAASIRSPDAEYAAFTADVPGTYVAALVVTDSTGRSSAQVRTTVTASACGTAAPVAAAQKTGPGASVSCGGSPIAIDLSDNNEVLLDGASSTDADNSCGATQTLFYAWTLLSTPLNGGDSNLMSTDGRTTVLDAQSNGEYRVRLIVTDSTGRSSRETVCILSLSNVG